MYNKNIIQTIRNHNLFYENEHEKGILVIDITNKQIFTMNKFQIHL